MSPSRDSQFKKDIEAFLADGPLLTKEVVRKLGRRSMSRDYVDDVKEIHSGKHSQKTQKKADQLLAKMAASKAAGKPIERLDIR